MSAQESDSAESVKVLVRVRPLNQNEQTDSANSGMGVQITSANSLQVSSVDQKKSFQCSYDAVLGPFASQAQVYDKVKDCTLAVMNGINATIFAYGQTGSGKTHSMYGPPNYINSHARETDQLGVIPRSINHIFEIARNQSLANFQVHCSFVQIYNENLYDMLRDPAMNVPLTIREDKNEIYVQGLSEYNVKSVADTLQLLKIAEDNRAIRETHMNQFSSRSHSIFQIFVEFKRMSTDTDGGGEVSYRSKFNLVDLAGSEKWDLRRDLRDEHIAEMTNINLSLHTLGKCISSLAKISRKRQKEASSTASVPTTLERASSDLDTKSSLDSSFGLGLTGSSLRNLLKPSTASVHVPFRESKLTRLLQDSLGGTAKTYLIATVSPARINCEESISTLKFADRAKQVMVQTVINESRPVDHTVVKKLQQELETMKGLIRRVVGWAGAESIKSCMQQQNDSLGDLERAFLTQALQGSTTAVGQPIPSASPKRGLPLHDDVHALTQGCGPGLGPGVDRSMNTMPPVLAAGTSMNVEAGSGLEYVISLEKALNKEQVHAQHLTKKNETLIKELEELKMINMQLTFQQHQQPSASTGNPMRKSGVNVTVSSDNSAGSFVIPDSEVQQVMSSVKLLMKQNEELLQTTDMIQKVMKKFFKFQIEEEQMKTEICKLFEALKEYKNLALVNKVNDNFAFLEFSAVASNTPSGRANTQGMFSSENFPSGSVHVPSLAIPVSGAQKSPHGKGSKLEGMSSSTTAATKPTSHVDASSYQGKPSGGGVKSKPRNLPSLSTGEGDWHPADVQASSSHPSQGSLGLPSQQHSTGDFHSPSQHFDDQPSLTGSSHPNISSSTGKLGISFRVRGGPGTNTAQESWAVPAMQEVYEEALLREELKKSKKKAKQQEKLQAWLKEKEEKALAEKQAQDEEKRAMQESELLKEAKRKEYVQRQKAKLASYQDRVKSEAEKIQELINLGIDPKSLNL